MNILPSVLAYSLDWQMIHRMYRRLKRSLHCHAQTFELGQFSVLVSLRHEYLSFNAEMAHA